MKTKPKAGTFLIVARLLKVLTIVGRHSTGVAFTLHAQPARVRITALENFSDVAVLIDSKDSVEKKLNKLIEPIQYW